ncbi:MAG TPA: S1 RNA-binding domain-containing protein [Patescibacteria group bacterium]|nr:S1 RNA-binding domain-containing protein [Patescibacteria group bacterium]
MTKAKVTKIKKETKTKENSSPAAVKEPTTMEELLALGGDKIRGLKRGEIIDGVVSEITPKSIFIDVGAKTDGVVLGKEFERAKDFVKNLKVGDAVKVYVGSTENEKGQILLSLRQAAVDFAWNNYEEMLKSELATEVKGREINRGGLIVDAPYSLQGFVPGSQIGSLWQGKLDQLVGRKLEVKVIEVNREQNRLVFSEKLISDAEKIERTAKAIRKLATGDSFEAEITQVAPFGLFAKILVSKEEVEGLVHISEISWQKVEDLTKLFKAGEKVKVKVISTDDSRVQFSIKQLLPDPWEELEKKFPADAKLSGKITRLTSFGALVEIEPGIEGLIHISKIPPEVTLNEGDKVDIYIESIDRQSRRISLGLVLSQKPIGYK